jgi:dTDP-glucose 4,6-dehydratase
MMGSSWVVHFAAETHVDRSLAGLEAEKLFFKTNVEGTQIMLYAAHKCNVRRFHHISTDEVFGDLTLDATEIFHEKFPYNPHNPYSISKAASDFIVRSFARTHNLPITISNCTNNYGPYQTPEKMIPRSISLLMAGNKIKLYTDENGVPGKNIRDWLHVLDHVIAIEHILLHGKDNETYCIGGQNEVSNIELVNIVLKEMSKITGKNYDFKKNVELVNDRPGHDVRYSMNIAKIKQELGWKPKITFKQGIKQTISWYLSKTGQNWLKNLSTTTFDVRKNQSKSF